MLHALVGLCLLFAFGSRVWIVLPKLIDFVPVPVGQVDPLGGACPVGFHAGETDSRVFADVGSSHPLTEVLESITSLLRRHSRQLLDFVGQLRVFRKLLIDGHPMR